MIGSIIWLVICFAWLLYETDWMRVRLPVGKDKPNMEVTHDLKCSLRYQFNLSMILDPICGWEWVALHRHDPIPVYNIEFRINGSKQTITNAGPKVLGEVMKIYRQPHKPKILKPSKYAVELAKYGMRVPV